MNLWQSITDSIWGTIRGVQNGGRWMRNKYGNQVQAAVNPHTTCFSHCTAWFLQNVVPGTTLTPDAVTREINGPIYEEYVRNTPGLGQWALSRYRGNLNQLWQVQEKFINDKLQLFGSARKAVFNANTSGGLIKTALFAGPVIVGTSPIYRGQRLGHIMLIVGYDQKTDSWFVDDPFGDFRTGYSSGHIDKGDDIQITVAAFEAIRSRNAIYAV
jgi:hypothetical protein